MIPCECGKCYNRKAAPQLKNQTHINIRSVKNLDVEKFTVVEHASQFIRFDIAAVLSKDKFWGPEKIREANINRSTCHLQQRQRLDA